MQINNIAITANKCKKPCNSTSFKANGFDTSEKRKVRYKHYEEMSDDVISLRSILKAHRDAQRSGKMHLYEAIPAITTGIIATSLAITRPGKLSAKAASGLGFLATMAGFNSLSTLAFSKNKEQRKDSYKTIGALGLVGAAATVMKKGNGKASEFLTKEVNQLASEINSTKLAEFSSKHIEPFVKKHAGISAYAPILTAITSTVLGGLASVGLMKSISKDIKENACKNFENAKMIQKVAREHFDSVDAVEV